MVTTLQPAAAVNLPTVSSKRQRFFLAKVMQELRLESLYDAKEITEIIYRTMRDLMVHDTIEKVASELDAPAAMSNQEQLDTQISDLWQDSNPLVRWLSHLRPSFDKEGILGINNDLFLQRIRQEGALPLHVSPLAAVKVVFSATKSELTPETQATVASCLPQLIKEVWQTAGNETEKAM